MPDEQPTTENQLTEIKEQINNLQQRLAHIERLAGIATPTISSPTGSPLPPAEPAPEPDSESTLLIGSSSLLKIISVLCFLLVAALGLRALTDNAVLSPQIGSIIGILYAAVLIISGHFLYRRANSMAPVFCTTGALLIFTIAIEAHARFSTLPEELAYLMLAITGIGLASISFMNKVALPIIVGTLGMCLSAVAIGYPTPYFPYLALMLWASNILGYFATRLKRCSWLRWLLLATTHMVLQVWGLKLSGMMLHGQENSDILSPGLFIPIVTLIGLTFMLIALFGIIRSGDEKVSKFDYSLPAVNASWCYIAGIYALKDPTAFGTPAVAAAIIHFAVAYWLSRRQKTHAQGTNTFMAGGIILVCLSLPALFRNMYFPLPILSVLAATTCYLSHRWSSGGMRITSYLLQIYISAVIVIEFAGGFQVRHQSLGVVMVSLFCCIIALVHFRFARRCKPPEHSLIFNQYDKNDQLALLTLFAGLVNSYCASILIAFICLKAFYQGDIHLALTAIESFVICFAAIILTLIATLRQTNEIRNFSIFVLLLGGTKVFMIDLFQIRGTWLVASIFSFGIAAALMSFVLARWKSTLESNAAPEKKSLGDNFSSETEK